MLLSFTQTEVELPDEECGDHRPPLERPCNMGPCGGGPGGLSPPGALPWGPGDELHHWDYRGFTICSATCAAGEEPRSVGGAGPGAGRGGRQEGLAKWSGVSRFRVPNPKVN